MELVEGKSRIGHLLDGVILLQIYFTKLPQVASVVRLIFPIVSFPKREEKFE